MPRVSAILLAAGMSQRMGKVKQLLPIAGNPAILHCLETIITSGIEDIVVVLNARAKEIKEIIGHLPVTIALNNDQKSEMAESVRIALHRVRSGPSGILVCLSDHPLISSNTLKTLIAWHEKEPDKIIIPVYQNRKGHPGLFPKHCADEIFDGGTLREIVSKDHGRVRFVEVHDEGIILDMDTPEDYRMITRHLLKHIH